MNDALRTFASNNELQDKISLQLSMLGLMQLSQFTDMYISNLVISKAIVISANDFNEGYKRLDNLSFYLMAIITSFQ